jgi:hypothetical protein
MVVIAKFKVGDKVILLESPINSDNYIGQTALIVGCKYIDRGVTDYILYTVEPIEGEKWRGQKVYAEEDLRLLTVAGKVLYGQKSTT